MKITFNSATLADDSAGLYVIDDSYRPSSAAAVQEVRAFRAAVISVIARGHKRTQVSFAVLKTHTDAAAAATFLSTETATVGTKSTLIVEEGSSSQSLSCGLTSVATLSRIGKTTVMQYTFLGGLFAATPA